MKVEYVVSVSLLVSPSRIIKINKAYIQTVFSNAPFTNGAYKILLFYLGLDCTELMCGKKRLAYNYWEETRLKPKRCTKFIHLVKAPPVFTLVLPCCLCPRIFASLRIFGLHFCNQIWISLHMLFSVIWYSGVKGYVVKGLLFSPKTLIPLQHSMPAVLQHFFHKWFISFWFISCYGYINRGINKSSK